MVRDKSYTQIGLDDIGGGISVSTVWLGLNHNYLRGPILIFETMVFPGNETERYSTLEAAKAGHKRWVHRLRQPATNE